MIKRICAAAALLAAGGIIGWAGSAGGEPAAAPQLQGGKLVDLSYELNERTIFWPTAKPFTLETVSEGVTEGGFFYAANRFCGPEHGGTHLDAPLHFAEGGPRRSNPLANWWPRGGRGRPPGRSADRDYRVRPPTSPPGNGATGDPASHRADRTGLARAGPTPQATWARPNAATRRRGAALPRPRQRRGGGC